MKVWSPLIFASCLALTLSLRQYRSNALTTQSHQEFLEENPIRRFLFKNKKKLFKEALQAAKLYFKGDYGTTEHWKPGVQETPQEQAMQMALFGYPLQIEHIIDENPTITRKPNRPTLYFHGWGDNKNSAKLMKKYLQSLPGDIVTFDFPDARGLFNLWHKASFAQLPDILPALYTLNYIYENIHPEAINLFGMSRGGGTIINMLAILNDKSGIYDQELTRIGIDNQRRSVLLNLIEHGTITLDCPLLDMNVAASHKFPKFIPRSWPTALLKKITRYNPNGLQAMHSVNNLDGLKLNTLIHFQHNDLVVTNQHEAQFYAQLANRNPKTTFLVLGNDGGHIHNHAALSRTIHTFQKKFGNSYDPNYDNAYQHNDTCLEGYLLSPEDPYQCITAFHNGCDHNKRK